eukprot:1161575-Pelagomonas_calceolata.AAC.11
MGWPCLVCLITFGAIPSGIPREHKGCAYQHCDLESEKGALANGSTVKKTACTRQLCTGIIVSSCMASCTLAY